MQTGVLALGDVVDNARLEAEVGVDEETGAENGVEGRVQGTSSEGSDSQGGDTSSEEALEGPVVRTVGGVGLRNGGRVVD